MLSNSTALTIAATCVCALGIGFFMQKTADARESAAQTAPSIVPVQGADQEVSLPLQDITYTSFDLSGAMQAAQALFVSEPTCATEMTATATNGAMVEIALSAPCRPDARFSIHHSGLVFADRLDSQGAARFLVPALTDRAVFLADFQIFEDLMAITHVEDVAQFDRVALQTGGTAVGPAVGLHVLETGAAYGDAGHIWANNIAGHGHFVTLGDPTLPETQVVQVYSLAKQDNQGAGEMQVSVDAEITAATCGGNLDALLLESRAGQMRSQDLTFEMPGCDATDGFLVLNNLVENLKLARN